MLEIHNLEQILVRKMLKIEWDYTKGRWRRRCCGGDLERRGVRGCVGGGSAMWKLGRRVVKIRETSDESSRSYQWSCCEEDNASNGAHCLPAWGLFSEDLITQAEVWTGVRHRSLSFCFSVGWVSWQGPTGRRRLVFVFVWCWCLPWRPKLE